MDVQAQGWFMKKASGIGKSQRRFFVLDGASLAYFAKADGARGVDRKGTIDLTGSSIVKCKGKDLSISVHGRTYNLQSDTAEKAAQWEQHLNQVIAALRSRTSTMSSSAPSSSSRTYSTASSVSRGRGVSMSKSTAIRTGWFVKKAEKVGKNQRRWFELYSSEIKYYAKQVEGKGKDSKGTIKLTAAVQVAHDDPELTVFTPSRTYYLISEEPGIAKLWAQDVAKYTPAVMRRGGISSSSPSQQQQQQQQQPQPTDEADYVDDDLLLVISFATILEISFFSLFFFVE